MPGARLTLLSGALLLASCGGASARTETSDLWFPPAPTESEWAAACDAAPSARLEAFRDLMVRDTTGPDRHFIEAWHPRGERADATSAIAIAVVRRMLQTCGERDAIALTRELVRFQTVATIAPPETNTEHQRMAQFLETFARDAGLGFRVHGPHDAWEIVLEGASDERSLALVVHADIVPVNDPPSVIEESAVPPSWTVPPFQATERDGRLYGRGTEDDKGPAAAAMLVLAAMSRAGIVPRGDVVLAFGTAEEHEWDGMRRYAAEAPRAEHVVSLDSSYPVVIAESGFVAWGVRVPRVALRRSERRAVATSAQGGLFLTQIPDHAEMLVAPPRGVALEGWVERVRVIAGEEIAARADEDFRAEVLAVDGAAQVIAHGRSAHSSTAEQGKNALWLLSGIAARLELAPNAIATTLAIVHELFDGDHYGERIDLHYSDDLMGALMIAPTVLRTEESEVRLEINMRRPRGLTAPEFTARLSEALERVRARFGASIEPVSDVYVGEAHVAELEGPLVPTLMSIYRAHTGDASAQPISIRGGTYARLFPGAVDFGPSFPGRPYAGHQADEFIELEALRAAVQMVFEATVRLTVEGAD